MCIFHYKNKCQLEALERNVVANLTDDEEFLGLYL